MLKAAKHKGGIMFGKAKIAALAAEFFGTAVLALVVLSISSSLALPFFSAIAAGLTAGIMVLVLGKFSGAHINPVVTLSLWVLKKTQTVQALVYIIAQLLAGVVVLQSAGYLLAQPLERSAAWGVDRRLLVAEALGAFIFAFGVAAAVYQTYAGIKLAAVIGGSLALGILVASIASNGIVNPALAIGLNAFSWAYVVGPLAGGILGMSVYAALFAPSPAKRGRGRRSN